MSRGCAEYLRRVTWTDISSQRHWPPWSLGNGTPPKSSGGWRLQMGFVTLTASSAEVLSNTPGTKVLQKEIAMSAVRRKLPGSTKTLPEHLYKYKSLEGKSRAQLEQLFREAVIFMAPPPSFNDPFDCRVRFTFPSSPLAYRKLIVSNLRKSGSALNRKEREAHAAEQVRRLQPQKNPSVQAAMVQDLQRDVDACGVFCLSECPDNILLWSHYGAGHRGLCLQFKTTIETKPDEVAGGGSLEAPAPMRVTYSSSFSSVPFFASSELHVETILLTKAEGWSYEREWRMVSVETGRGLWSFDPPALSGVIFGCRMEGADRAAVKAWIASGPTRPRLYEARLREQAFAVEVVPLDDGGTRHPL
jgi:Protein of unknown function (DUF2971)